MSKVYFYVPNIIGYLRIVAAIAAYYYSFDDPLLFLGLYTFSFVADALDGMAARAFNQCSRFGAVLDMVTDRAATSGLVVILSYLMATDDAFKTYSKQICFTGAMLVGLDIVSHFARMYKSLVLQESSHKNGASGRFWLLDMYYGNRKVMGALCIGQEFFYIGLYVFLWGNKTQSTLVSSMASFLWEPYYVLAVLGVLCGLKQLTNVYQFLDSMADIAVADVADEDAKEKKA